MSKQSVGVGYGPLFKLPPEVTAAAAKQANAALKAPRAKISYPEELKITTRDQLVQALTFAAEIEHMATCLYLFAAYSMKKDASEFPNTALAAYQWEKVREWEGVLVLIARQEMIHLGHVSNLLTAVGAEPYFQTPIFPTPPMFEAPDVWWSLERFSVDTLNRFITIEHPDWSSKIGTRTPLNACGYATVGELYEAIEDGFTYLDAKGNLFVGSPAQQVVSTAPTASEYVDAWMQGSSTHYPPGNPAMGLLAVTNLASAKTVIEAIILEGEGNPSWNPSDPNSVEGHWREFTQVMTDYKTMLAQDPAFDPARPVVRNPVPEIPCGTDPKVAAGMTVVTNEFTKEAMLIFNVLYKALVHMLKRFFFCFTDPTSLGVQNTAFFPLMTMGIRPFAEVLSILPTEEVPPTQQPPYSRTCGPYFNISGPVLNVSIQQIYEYLAEARDRLLALITTQAAKVAQYHAGRFQMIWESLMLFANNFATDENLNVKPGIPKDLQPKLAFKAYHLPRHQTPVAAATTTAGHGHALIAPVPVMMAVHFEGWFQIRLATDPDPTDENKGISGSTFALKGEPDFDRILRLQPEPPLTVTRTHTEDQTLGVNVVGVKINGVPQTSHPLLGAPVQLVQNPKFEARNNALYESGLEPLDPFHIYIQSKAPAGKQPVEIRRKDVWDLQNPDLPFLDPKIHNNPQLTTRRAAQVTIMPSPVAAAKTGIYDPPAYRAKRAALLQIDLANEEHKPNPDPNVIAELQKRIYELTNDIQPYLTKQNKLTWQRIDSFTINGPPTSDNKYYSVSDPSDLLGGKILPQGLDQTGWPVQYWLGAYDSDSLQGYMEGDLLMPFLPDSTTA